MQSGQDWPLNGAVAVFKICLSLNSCTTQEIVSRGAEPLASNSTRKLDSGSVWAGPLPARRSVPGNAHCRLQAGHPAAHSGKRSATQVATETVTNHPLSMHRCSCSPRQGKAQRLLHRIRMTGSHAAPAFPADKVIVPVAEKPLVDPTHVEAGLVATVTLAAGRKWPDSIDLRLACLAAQRPPPHRRGRQQRQ